MVSCTSVHGTEMARLTNHGTHVAGFTDVSVETRTELYNMTCLLMVRTVINVILISTL